MVNSNFVDIFISMNEYSYIDKHGNKCLCKLKVDVKTNLVYIEEHKDNQGCSIKDSAGQLANQVSEEFGLIKNRLIWLEKCKGYYMVEFILYNFKLTSTARIKLSKNEVLKLIK